MLILQKIMIKLLMPLINLLTPPCEVISQKISLAMDEKLSLRERLQVRLHLLGCALCTRYEKQLLAMRKVIEDNPGGLQTESRLSDEARQRMKSKIKPNKAD